MRNDTKDRIASIIGNRLLARALHSSISSGLKAPFFRLFSHKAVWNIFETSLNAAIRDIEKHPRGKLFKRLLEFGPHDPGEPEVLDCDGKTTLSDPECGI
jgi:hypothetical protein